MAPRIVLAIALVIAVVTGAPWPRPRAVSPAVAANAALDELMMDLNIAPLEAVAAPALTVKTLEGNGRVSLADMKGRAVLVYFWATW